MFEIFTIFNALLYLIYLYLVHNNQVQKYPLNTNAELNITNG